MNDSTFDALANERRREVLIELLDENPRPDHDGPPTDGGHDLRVDERANTVEMFHVHLPKLEHYGIIDWNRDAHEIVKGPRFDEVRPVVELLADHTDE